MQFNELAQLLLPLTGLYKRVLVNSRIRKIEVGLKDENSTTYSDRPDVLFLKTDKGIVFHDTLDMYTMKDGIVYILKVEDRFREDWKLLMEGRYSEIGMAAKATILSNLGTNRKRWKNIIEQNDVELIRYIMKKISDKKTEKEKEQIARDTIEDMESMGIKKPELYVPLSTLNYTINEKHNNSST